MREIIDFNDNWIFDRSIVRLPHTAVEMDFNYLNEENYQREFVYEKVFTYKPKWSGKDIIAVFEAAMANARVFLNDVKIATHTDGYTPFSVRMTDHLRPGKNTLKVELGRAQRGLEAQVQGAEVGAAGPQWGLTVGQTLPNSG